jgi:hypothetical protein
VPARCSDYWDMKAFIVGVFVIVFLAFIGLAELLTLRRKAAWGPESDDDP